MASNGKMRPCKPVDGGNAAAQIEDPAASVAVKMVVVGLAGPFIDRARAGNLDRNKPAFGQQSFDIPVNRCQPHALNIDLRRIENLVGRERTAGSIEGLANGRSLSGVSLVFSSLHHPLMIPRSQ